MYAYQTAAPAPPHSLPHMTAPNNHHSPAPPSPHRPHTPQPYANGGYEYGGGPYTPPASLGGHGYNTPSQSYTVHSHPHYPPPPPTLPNSAGPQAFNDFGMPSHSPSHPATHGGFPSRSPPPRSSGYQGFQGFPTYTPPAPGPVGPEAIPSPVRKADYQAPQFKTFAERKREREAELRRKAAEAAAAQVLPASPAPKAPVSAPESGANPLPYRAPPPASPSAPPGSPSAAAMRMMASAGEPGARPTPPPRSISGPAPPHSPIAPGGRALPTPRGVSGPSPSPGPQPWAGVDTPPVPPIPVQHRGRQEEPPSPHWTPSAPPHSMRPVSPSPGANGARSVSPIHHSAPQPLQHHHRPEAPPSPHWAAPAAHSMRPLSLSPGASAVRSVSPVPGMRSVSPAPPVPQHSVPQRSIPQHSIPGRPMISLPPGVVHNAAVQALLERSDTVSSVRSVDRGGFGPKRELPQPPVGVRSSLSLDRGSSPTRRNDPPLPRRGPSPVAEESAAELAVRMAATTIGSSAPPSIRSTSPNPVNNVARPRSQSPTKRVPVPSHSVGPPPPPPVITVGSPPKAPSVTVDPPQRPGSSAGLRRQPAVRGPPPPIVVEPSKPPAIVIGNQSPPTPTITVGTPPTPTINVSPPAIAVDGPPSPGFSYSGLPTIEVSSSHTSYERDAGPVSIAVPGGNRSKSPVQRANSPRSAVGPTRIEPNSAILCAGCHHPIIGRIVSAMQQRWHPQCFNCDGCNGPLEHVSSYEHESKPYCHLCYHDRFAHKCHHCHTAIVDPRFITLNDEVLGERYYHELHFFCSECGDPFLDPSKSSAAGTEFGGGNDDDGETNAFVIHKGHPYCERCHLRLHKPKCRACKNPIPDVAVSAMGAKWHKECFVCSTCACPFANNIFFPRDSKAFCTECFERMTEL